MGKSSPAGRQWCLLLLAVVPLLFAGCGKAEEGRSPFDEVDTIDGVWIEAKEGTVTSTGTVEAGARDPVGGLSVEAGDVTPTGMEVIFHNLAEWEDLVYGLDFSLDWFNENQEWEPYPKQPQQAPGEEPIPTYANAVAIFIRPGDSTHTIDWAWKYGELPPGFYCLTLNVVSTDTSEPTDTDGYPFSVMFHVI